MFAPATSFGGAEDDEVRHFDIARQRADQALIEFAEQADVTFIFPVDEARKVTSNEVQGEFDSKQAIEKLLAGTGLQLNVRSDGAWSVDANSGSTKQEENVAKKSLLAVLIAAVAGSGPTISRADQAADSAEKPVKLEEILVTAQKRVQRLQDVPVAISAVTGETLEEMGAQSFTDYARSIPGLTFQDAGAGRQIPTIRGINPTAGAPAVSYYIDETPMPANLSFVVNPRLTDIARVEVLRGPQGTLYGSSSIGGTIKLVPNAPDLSQVTGSVQALGIATDGADGTSLGADAELVLNIPVVQDVAAVRGAFWGRNADGYINRTYPPDGSVGNIPNEETWGFRITGLFQPSEQLDISAMAYVQDQHFDGFSDITGGEDNPNDQLVQDFLADVSEPQDSVFQLYNVTAEYSFGRLSLVSSTSYSDQEFDYSSEGMSAVQLFPTFFGQPPLEDEDAFPTTARVPIQTYAFTQELRLATSETISGFDTVVGAFYSDVHQRSQFHWSPPEYNAVVAGDDPSNPLYAPDNNILTAWGPGEKERQVAGFGELTYHFTDLLSVTGGLRYYDISNSNHLFTSGWFVGGNQPGVVDEAITSADSDGFVYKANVSYQPTSDYLFYALYSEGFRRGFGNRPLPPVCNAENQLQVDPDSIENYELGVKTAWLDRRLTVNGAAYRVDWTDIQQGVLLPCGFNLITNFGSAEVNGGELEIVGELTERISAGASGTYLDATLQQDLPTLGAFEGDQILYVPNWQYALYVETSFPLLEVSDGFARLDYQYTDSFFANYNRLSDGTRDPAAKIPAVDLLNFRGGVRYQNWEFTLAVQNVLDDVTRQSLDPNAIVTFAIPGRPRYVVTRPRTFLLGVTYQF